MVLNPASPVGLIEESLDKLDMVLLMSVNPDLAVKSLLIRSNKITKVRSLIEKNNLNTRLEVDGGINLENISQIASAGADTFVAGSAIFNENDYSAVIKKMRSS